MDDLIERVQSAIDRPDKPNIIGMHVDDAKALLARIKHTERQIAAACAYSAAATAERDANEALDAMLAEAREDALREVLSAAEIHRDKNWHTDLDYTALANARDDLRLRALCGYGLRVHVRYQDGRNSLAPALVFADADYEVGDGTCGLHSDGKQANEPAIVYARADALIDANDSIEALAAERDALRAALLEIKRQFGSTPGGSHGGDHRPHRPKRRKEKPWVKQPQC